MSTLLKIFNNLKPKSIQRWLIEKKDTFNEKDLIDFYNIFEQNELEYNKLNSIIFIPFKQEHIFPQYSRLENWGEQKAIDSIPHIVEIFNKIGVYYIKKYTTENGIYLEPYWNDGYGGGKSRWINTCISVKYLMKKNTGLDIDIQEILSNVTYEQFKYYITERAITDISGVYLVADDLNEKTAREIIMNSGDKKCSNIKLTEFDFFNNIPYETIINEKMVGKITFENLTTEIKHYTQEELIKMFN